MPGNPSKPLPACWELTGLTTLGERIHVPGPLPRQVPALQSYATHPPLRGAGIQPNSLFGNYRSPPPRNLKVSVRDSQGHGGETLPREEAEKGRDKHGKTRSGGRSSWRRRRGAEHESVSMGVSPGRVSGGARNAVASGPTPGAPISPPNPGTALHPQSSSLAYPSPFAPQPCTQREPPP